MRWRRNIVDELPPVVEIKVYFPTEGIQAMDLMEDIQTSDMGVIAETKGIWELCRVERINTSFPHVF